MYVRQLLQSYLLPFVIAVMPSGRMGVGCSANRAQGGQLHREESNLPPFNHPKVAMPGYYS